MIEQIQKETELKMEKTISVLNQELSTIRTGRASPALVDHIKADYHGVPTPLNQIASISIPEAKMIMIQPWDRSAIKEIEKAILKSDIGLNPNSDGSVIRIAIPALTEERRKDLIKNVHKRLEDSRVAIRNIRREAMEHLKRVEKEKEISQDQSKRTSDLLQKMTDVHIEKVNQLGQKKEAEISEI